jgi:GntR family transcriptional regulator
MTDPLSDRPAYRQVADRLRAPIESGEWPAGYRLPSESQLMEQFSVSRVTVRLAINALRGEGLIVTRQGRGSFVRDRAASRRMSSSRYLHDAEFARNRVAEPAPRFGAAAAEDHNRYRLERSFREERASQQVADLLGLPVGEPVLQRRYVHVVDDRPERISVSYLPMELVRDTEIADPGNEPWPGGTIAQLHHLGHAVTRVTELVRARMPSPDEARTLAISAGVPVLSITRRMLVGPQKDKPLEAALEIVLPADRVILEYIIDLGC